MEDHSTKITETLYDNNRMSLNFFMHLPEGIYTNKDHDGIRLFSNPSISLLCKRNEANNDFYDFQTALFRITVYNQYQVIKFFNKLMRWLYDDAFNDLFLIDAKNKLMFNSDYKSLHENVMFYGKSGTSVLSAVPSLVQLGDKVYEGINLFVNTTDYMIPLSHEELGVIFSILSQVNFSAEVTKLLTMYNFTIQRNRVHPSKSETSTPFD